MAFPLGIIASSIPAMPSAGIVQAACESGHIGMLALDWVASSNACQAQLEALLRSDTSFSLSIPTFTGPYRAAVELAAGRGLNQVVLEDSSVLEAGVLASHVSALSALGLNVLMQVSSIPEARRASECGAHGLIAKGNESGGMVGEETTLVLLQRVVAGLRLPVFARGGIGLRSSAACLAAGAAGVVLDWQLALCVESSVPADVRARLERLDGSETAIVGQDLGRRCRIWVRPGDPAFGELKALEEQLVASADQLAARGEWDRLLAARIASGAIVPMGQDVCFASELAGAYGSVGRVCDAIGALAERQCRVAARLDVLKKHGPAAESHGTLYPIAQGPMTRVSDRADFALAVADSGGLPFLALALMRGKEVAALLEETSRKLDKQAWGIGILGFVPRELRDEQMQEARKYKPPFAIIAGGRPDQAKALEQEGTRTYLHVPSPELLRNFLDAGARRVVFEGRECGGHVGPRSSFVLWDQMIRVILSHLAAAGADAKADEYHVLFAGGIHDQLSASMVAAMAAPLSERGVRVGVLLGTAYLFTAEAVSTGAITSGFQEEALRCDETILLETGVGHSTRCAGTQFGEHFASEKRRLLREGRSKEEIREALEGLNLGRLRIAAKGITREDRKDGTATQYVAVDDRTQRLEGMYMIGQVAALRTTRTTIAELHREVSTAGQRLYANFARPASVQGKNGAAAIAIVGMSCVFPKAPGAPDFWRNILNKVNAITEVPKERWDTDLYFNPDRRAKDKVYSKWGGFIGDVAFDPTRYGMPPNTVPSIEPMQLLTLEMVRQALEDAGYDSRRFHREKTSVVVGTGGGVGELGLGYGFRSLLPQYVDSAGGTMNDAEVMIGKLGGHLPEWTEDSFAGLLLNVVAGRVANRFDLGGTNYIVDAACATSLAALRLGVNELQSGSSDVVIAASSDMMQTPFGYLCFSKTQALSPTGQCRTFDESADGIVISEGVAVTVLKRLEDAENDGDEIYAVIRSVGASSDGRDKGLTAPRPIGQMRALERAYDAGAVDPATIGLIEAHGTGTVVGDRTEVESLTTFFQREGAGAGSCALGSVKSMVGHTKCSAGMAGLVKASLALRHRVLPPTGGITQPNSKANFPATPFYLNTERRPWFARPDGVPRRAGVSAFGFGGTNFHAVLEEHAASTAHSESGLADWPAELLLWRGESSAVLTEQISTLASALREGSRPRLAELAASVWWEQRNTQGTHCLAIVAGTLEELAARLDASVPLLKSGAAVQDPSGIYYSPNAILSGKVAFLFPGQGSQRADMLADLAIAFPVVRQTFEAADRVLAGVFDRPLTSTVFPAPAFGEADKKAQETALRRTRFAQPALGASDIALYRLLKRLGIRPEMAAGHSYGEFAALCAAGAMSFDQLIAISEARGRFIEVGAQEEAGAMAAVDAGETATTSALNGLAEVWTANLNSPRQTVIAGTRAGIEAAIAKLSAAKLNARALPVACAFHSPLVAPAAESLTNELNRISLRSPRFPVFSNTTAAPYADDPSAVRDVLASHLTSPVRFADELKAMYEAGARVFVEAGPGKVLTGLVNQTLGEQKVRAIALDQPGRSSLAQLAHALAQLAVAGIRFHATPLLAGRVEQLSTPLKQLLAAGKPKPHSATTWMITAGRSVPIQKFNQPAQPAAPRTSLFTPPALPPAAAAPSLQTRPHASVQVALQPSAAQPVAALESSLLRTHRSVMVQMLETHRGIMMAALGNPAVLSTPLTVRERPAVLQPVPPALAPTVAVAVTAPPAMSATPATPEVTRETISVKLLEIVSLRTGYPPEMLNLDLDMEADLGIDSIKRIEILGELQSASLLGANALDNEIESLTRLKTLRAIIDWIADRASSPAAIAAASESAPSAVAPATPALTRELVTQRLLEVVSLRTGYPPEMLNLDLDMEADLGIDSIKRIEILGELQSASLLGANALDNEIESLTRLKTLRAIIDWIVERSQAVPVPAQPPTGPAAMPEPGPPPRPAANRPLVRMEARVVPAVPHRGPVAIDNRGLVLIVEDGLGVSAALAARLTAASVQAEIVSTADQLASITAPVMALVYLPSLAPAPAKALEEFEARFEPELKGLYQLSRQLEKSIRGSGLGSLIAATRMGGTFGLGDGAEEGWPGSGAVCGFVKAVSREWSDVNCKAVDFEASAAPRDIAEALYSELAARDGLLEVGYRDRERFTIASIPCEAKPSTTSHVDLDAESVFVVTGGARGITAEIAVELAHRYRSKLVLIGRSPLPAEPDPELAAISDDRALKTALIKRHQSPAAVESAFRQIRQESETRSYLAAMEAAGSPVEYVQADAGDAAAFGAAIDGIYEKFGRIDGVIHGAGIIEDKLLRDKTPESFDRVLRPKINGALTLARKLRPERLRFVAFFSSVSARYGNRGQCDYAAANETLNKLAGWLNRQWPETQMISLNWGPWASARGMVSTELAARFAEAGVQMVTPEQGRAAFAAELGQGRREGVVEVLFGGPLPSAAAVAAGEAPARPSQDLPLLESAQFDGGAGMVLDVNPQSHTYLLDHCLDGRPVMPMAMMLELAAEVGANASSQHVTFVRDVRLLKGIGFDDGATRRLRVDSVAAPLSLDGVTRLDLTVHSDTQAGNQLNYRAQVELGGRFPKAPALPRLRLLNPRPLPLSVVESYESWLFHGPRFAGIVDVEALGDNGIIATLETSSPSRLFEPGRKGEWLVDPVMVDSGFQLVILWARATLDKTPLPSSLGCYHRYAEIHPGAKLRCEASVEQHPGHPNVIADLKFFEDNRLVGWLEQIRVTVSRDLNRLAHTRRMGASA